MKKMNRTPAHTAATLTSKLVSAAIRQLQLDLKFPGLRSGAILKFQGRQYRVSQANTGEIVLYTNRGERIASFPVDAANAN